MLFHDSPFSEWQCNLVSLLQNSNSLAQDSITLPEIAFVVKQAFIQQCSKTYPEHWNLFLVWSYREIKSSKTKCWTFWIASFQTPKLESPDTPLLTAEWQCKENNAKTKVKIHTVIESAWSFTQTFPIRKHVFSQRIHADVPYCALITLTDNSISYMKSWFCICISNGVVKKRTPAGFFKKIQRKFVAVC